MSNQHQRPFLKYAGGKYRLLDTLKKHLPSAPNARLVEPFVGGGSVFLNTDYAEYLLCDNNQDLINLYETVKMLPERFIKEAKALFTDKTNDKAFYYEARAKFNFSADSFEKSLLFLYLNRHSFNGLCRYNQSNLFNAPFGAYEKVYFPHQELLAFSRKAQNATFRCCDFRDAFGSLKNGDVIYCDPPFVPLSKTANFTSYSGKRFTLDDQALLNSLAVDSVQGLQTTCLISNHATAFTRKLYEAASIKQAKVQRNISRNGKNRKKVTELIAVYQPS